MNLNTYRDPTCKFNLAGNFNHDGVLYDDKVLISKDSVHYHF